MSSFRCRFFQRKSTCVSCETGQTSDETSLRFPPQIPLLLSSQKAYQSQRPSSEKHNDPKRDKNIAKKLHQLSQSTDVNHRHRKLSHQHQQCPILLLLLLLQPHTGRHTTDV
ncbi:uncharacterized protein V6R79_005512 [Siganus canaliculatus]